MVLLAGSPLGKCGGGADYPLLSQNLFSLLSSGLGLGLEGVKVVFVLHELPDRNGFGWNSVTEALAQHPIKAICTKHYLTTLFL